MAAAIPSCTGRDIKNCQVPVPGGRGISCPFGEQTRQDLHEFRLDSCCATPYLDFWRTVVPVLADCWTRGEGEVCADL